MTKVTAYALSWSAKLNKGFINLTLADGSREKFEVDSPNELSALGDVLRNSSDVGYDLQAQALTTKEKPPGS